MMLTSCWWSSVRSLDAKWISVCTCAPAGANRGCKSGQGDGASCRAPASSRASSCSRSDWVRTNQSRSTAWLRMSLEVEWRKGIYGDGNSRTNGKDR
eukprot:9502231-Pyramimonas_sp.AAC.1